MNIILETEQLILRELEYEDAPFIVELDADPEVMRFIGLGVPQFHELEKIRKGVDRDKEGFKKNGFWLWAVQSKLNNKFMGWAGMLPFPETGEVEVGYRFLREYWGHGFATEITRAILKHAFETLKMKRIIAIVQPANKASVRVLEKSGLKYEKMIVHRSIPVAYYSIEAPQPIKK